MREARAHAIEAHCDLACPASSPTQQALSSESPQPSSQIPTHPLGLLPSRAAAAPPLSPCKRLPRASRVGGAEPRALGSGPSPCHAPPTRP